MKTLITPAIVMAMLGYGILLTLFFNLPLSSLPDYSAATPAVYLLELLGNLRDGIERPQLILKIISLSGILAGAALCLACYLNKKRMNLLRLIFAGLAFAGSIGCGLGCKAISLPILAGICLGLSVYSWKSYRPARHNESNLFQHALPIMMRHPECLILSTGLLMLIITQAIALIFAEEGSIGLYVAYPFLLLGRLMVLYSLWASGKKYKQYRTIFMLAGASSVLSVLDILCSEYLGCGLFASIPRLGIDIAYPILEMTALAFMFRNTKRKLEKLSVLLLATYLVITYLLGANIPRATLILQLPILVFSNLIIILGATLFMTNLYRKADR